MNIFRILSTGDGRLHEPNMSSLLAFFLNPNQTHGLKKDFLHRFFNLIKDDDDFFDVNDESLEIDVQCEITLLIEGLRKRHSDILISFYKVRADSAERKLVKCICIENKIRINAEQTDQIGDLFKGMQNNLKIKATETLNYLIYVTPEGCVTPKLNSDSKICFKHKYWSSKSGSLIDIVKDTIVYNNLLPQSDYLLKSFFQFIEIGFKADPDEEKDPIYTPTPAKDEEDFINHTKTFCSKEVYTIFELLDKSISAFFYENKIKPTLRLYKTNKNESKRYTEKVEGNPLIISD